MLGRDAPRASSTSCNIPSHSSPEFRTTRNGQAFRLRFDHLTASSPPGCRPACVPGAVTRCAPGCRPRPPPPGIAPYEGGRGRQPGAQLTSCPLTLRGVFPPPGVAPYRCDYCAASPLSWLRHCRGNAAGCFSLPQWMLLIAACRGAWRHATVCHCHRRESLVALIIAASACISIADGIIIIGGGGALLLPSASTVRKPCWIRAAKSTCRRPCPIRVTSESYPSHIRVTFLIRADSTGCGPCPVRVVHQYCASVRPWECRSAGSHPCAESAKTTEESRPSHIRVT